MDFFDLHCDTVSRLTEGGGIADADAQDVYKRQGSGTCWDADPSQITGPDNLLYTGCPGSFFGGRGIAFVKE